MIGRRRASIFGDTTRTMIVLLLPDRRPEVFLHLSDRPLHPLRRRPHAGQQRLDLRVWKSPPGQRTRHHPLRRDLLGEAAGELETRTTSLPAARLRVDKRKKARIAQQVLFGRSVVAFEEALAGRGLEADHAAGRRGAARAAGKGAAWRSRSTQEPALADNTPDWLKRKDQHPEEEQIASPNHTTSGCC